LYIPVLIYLKRTFLLVYDSYTGDSPTLNF
jgi:hypothetical protein